MDLPEDVAEGSGLGISNEAADNLHPLVTILQPLSQDVDRTSDKYIEGAEPGTILLRSDPVDPVVDGTVGLLFQRCGFQRVWIEWVDREKGGGFVARYADVDGAPDCQSAERADAYSFVNSESGNRITNHHNHVGYVLGRGAPQPYMISYKGAGISESRQWMSLTPRMIGSKKTDAPMFKWLLQAKMKRNSKGRWFDIHPTFKGLITRDGEVDREQIAMGRQLAQSVVSQSVQGDFAQLAQTSSDAEPL
jgi:hypothetical protein